MLSNYFGEKISSFLTIVTLFFASFFKFSSRRRKLLLDGNNSGFVIQISFVIIFILTVILAFLLVEIYPYISQPAIQSINLLIDGYRDWVAPEPVERFVFMMLAASIPLICFFVMIVMANDKVTNNSKFVNCRSRIDAGLPFVVVVLLFSPFFGSEFISVILNGYSEPYVPVYSGLAVSYSISLLWCSWKFSGVAQSNFLSINISKTFVWLIFIGCLLLQMLSWRLVGVNSVTSAFEWSCHVDAAIYALSQVVAGKTLLVDLPSQYGMFPEILAPLYRLKGLSVLGFSSLFGMLQLVSLASIFIVLTRLVRTPSLRILSGIALLVVTFETVLFFSGYDERYFQYWPLRFFWPAMSVLVFYLASQKKSLLSSALMSLVGAIGLLWNMDTGLFIVLAYGAFLSARLIVCLLHRRRSIRTDKYSGGVRFYGRAILMQVCITAFVTGVFFSMLALKSGKLLEFSWLFDYQKVFYNLGFMMLPMPRGIDPWMSVLGVYLLGLLASLHSWLNNPSRRKTDVVFYLSMLGMGLFFYYQGRSHVLNLVSVCWPAIVIVAILTDTHLRAIRAGILPATQIFLPAAAVSFFLICFYSFASHGELMAAGVKSQFLTRGVPKDPVVMNELEFVKKYAAGKKECLILSKRQGIYYAESGLASPLKGPGFVEMLLNADQDRLIAKILHGGVPCIFIGIGEHSYTGIKLDPQQMRENYLFVAGNSQNTMLYLESKH
jgi:hypothetical protein